MPAGYQMDRLAMNHQAKEQRPMNRACGSYSKPNYGDCFTPNMRW